MLKATSKIIKQDGPGALLAGLGPTVVGYGIEGAAKFGIYEVLKPVFGQFIEDQSLAFIMASVAAGAVAALILCPAESVRIRIVTDKEYADKGLLTGLPKLINEEGLLELFAGFSAMISKQVPYTMAKQVSFDLFAKFLYSLFQESEKDMKWIVSISAAALASVLACLASQPGDMILTETYKGKTPGSFGDVIGKIWGRGGPSEFFVGTQARKCRLH
jgi:solute carrier family 25 phosphate transporter 3